MTLDLDRCSVRELNAALYRLAPGTQEGHWRIDHPRGKHALAVGLHLPIDVEINGPVGYYCGGMNQEARIAVHGHAGKGLGENIMSGSIRVDGNVSDCAGASGHGGLIVIDGDAASRCGISMKGVDIVAGGSIGDMAAFMAQAGRLVVCGDAGQSLGDSIYEAKLYVRGKVASLGADCVEKEMTEAHRSELGAMLGKAGFAYDPRSFRRYGSARKLYNFQIDHADAY
jgi:glutamate synthase domain-containing protein 3